MNGDFEKINGGEYLILLSTKENKEEIKKYMKKCRLKSEI